MAGYNSISFEYKDDVYLILGEKHENLIIFDHKKLSVKETEIKLKAEDGFDNQ